MFLIRSVEEEISTRYIEGKMRCPTHLSIGQESVPAILEEFLTIDDYATSTHRGHAHYLAKGGNLKAMISEIYGKQTGCSKGRGGSMHLIDLNVNFMGTSAIVGNSIPIGVGLALSAQINMENRLSVVYMGDAAVEEGAFYESANFATLKNLPVIFICENNFYSVYSDLKARQPENRKLTDIAKGIGLSTFSGNAYDTEDCYKSLNLAVDTVRNEKLPTFVEMKTYRWREHCGPNYDNNLGYRKESEFLKWKSKDPLQLMRRMIISKDASAKANIMSIELEVAKKVREAFEFAEKSPFPPKFSVGEGVYSREIRHTIVNPMTDKLNSHKAMKANGNNLCSI